MGKGGKGPKGGGKGRGFGKGPVDGCWICGGKHYASSCPKGKGKGKLGWFEGPDDWSGEESEEGSLKYLSSLSLMKKPTQKPIQTTNYWSTLQEKDGESRIADVLSPVDAALSGEKLGLGSSKGTVSGPSHTEAALSGPGVGSDSFLGTPTRVSRGFDAALGGDRCSRGPRVRKVDTMLAQEFEPPPAAIDGAGLVAAAKRKERHGDKQKRSIGEKRHVNTHAA